jgi:chromosome segregation ATPase
MSITTLFGTRLLSGLGALAIAGSVAGGTALAGEPNEAAGKGKGKGNEVSEARHELKDRIEPEREAIAELRRQLADEYAKADPDEAELQRLHDAIQAHRDAISDMRHAALVDMHDELDAEKRAKVAERIAGKDEGKGEGKAKDKAKSAKKDKKDKDESEGKAKGKGKGKAEKSDDR